MALQPKLSDTKLVTNKIRVGYVNLITPRKGEDGSPDKYSLMLIIPKSDKAMVKALFAAEEAAKATDYAKKKWGGSVPRKLESVIKDGDEDADLEKNPELEGCYYLNASSQTKPGLVDRNLQAIMDPAEIYSGMWCRVSINAYGYSYKDMKKGVTFGLNNVQKLADDEPFGGVASRAEDDFDELDDDEEDLV